MISVNEEESAEGIRVGLVGAGNMAIEHARAFSDVKGVKLVGIHSRTRKRAEDVSRQFDIPVVADSVERLGLECDLLVVAVPVHVMEEVAIKCMASCPVVLLEKPAGLNLSSSLRIKQAQEISGAKVYVGLNRRCLSSTLTALDGLGDESTRLIQIEDQQDLERARRFGHDKEVLTSWMFANSIHTIDYFSIFGRGGVKEVNVLEAWNPEKLGRVVAHLKFESGDTGIYVGRWAQPGPWSATITNDDARWELCPLERAGFQAKGTRNLEVKELSQWDCNFKPGFRMQAQEVVNAIKGRENRAVSLKQSLHTMDVISKIYECT